MTQGDENHLSMFQSVETVLNENSSIVEAIPALKEAKVELSGLIKGIKEEEAKIKKGTGGVSDDRDGLKQVIASLIYEVACCLQSHADKSKNVELLAKSNYSESKIERLRIQEFGVVGEVILGLAQEHKADLLNHGLEEEELDDLKDYLDVWNGKKDTPRKAILVRKSLNDEQDKLFRTAEDLLKRQIDNLVEKQRKKQPDFHRDYWNARKVIGSGGRKVTHEEKVA